MSVLLSPTSVSAAAAAARRLALLRGWRDDERAFCREPEVDDFEHARLGHHAVLGLDLAHRHDRPPAGMERVCQEAPPPKRRDTVARARSLV